MQADLIVEGKIATCDAHNRIVEAFAVKDGKIIACGTLEECVLFKGEKTKTVIQDTGLIIPGMTEGHAHASKTGNLIFGINLYGEHSVGIYQQKIRKYIKDHPDRDVILGKGFLNGVFSNIGPTADLLNETEVVSLHRAIRKVLRDGLANGGTSFRDYRNGEGKRGHNQDHLKVYGRGGKPCVRCGRPLADMTLRGRHTVFCEKCQK